MADPQNIPLPDLPAFSIEVEMDGAPYRLSLAWNARAAFWSLGLATSQGIDLVTGLRLVVDLDLLESYHTFGVPPGELFAVKPGGQGGELTRDDFALGNAFLAYVPVG